MLELTRSTILSYDGNYDDYLAFKERKEAAVFGAPLTENTAAVNKSSSAPSSESKLDWKEQKEAQAQQRKLANRIAALEKTIEECETRIAEIDELMVSPEICTNSLRLNELSAEKEALDEKLLEAMTEWEELNNTN